MVADIGYAQAFSFTYSPRPGTPAATMDGQVSKAVMDERLQRLQALVNEQQHAFNRARIGVRTDILIERRGKLSGQMLGKSPWLQSVHIIDSALVIGDLVTVDLVAAGPNSLTGVTPLQNAA